MYTRNAKRFDPSRTFEFEGVTYQGNITAFPEAMERAGITEIPDVPRPDVSDDTHFVFPIDEAPWWSVTEKPVEMVEQLEDSRLIQRMEALESKSMRAVREAILTGDKTKLQVLEDKIADLRTKLKRQAAQ